jgi:hypothetical protein
MDVHAYPLDDIVEHELTPECSCGPTVEAVFDEGVLLGWLYTHHSLDGREFGEDHDWMAEEAA